MLTDLKVELVTWKPEVSPNKPEPYVPMSNVCIGIVLCSMTTLNHPCHVQVAHAPSSQGQPAPWLSQQSPERRLPISTPPTRDYSRHPSFVVLKGS